MRLYYFEGKELEIFVNGYVLGKNEKEALKNIDENIEIEKFEYIKRINFKKLSVKEHLKLIKLLKSFISTKLNFFDAIVYIRNSEEISQRIKIVLDLLINNIKAGNSYEKALKMNAYFDSEFRKAFSKATNDEETIKILNRLEKVYSDRLKNSEDIKNIMLYPILLFSALIGLLSFLQFIIVPIFKSSFNTEFNFVASWIIILIIFFLITTTIILLKNRHKYDNIIYKIPLVGKIYRKYALLEFVQITTIFVESGDNTYNAFEKSLEIISSNKLKNEIISILSYLEEGNNIVEATKNTDLKELLFSITISKNLSDIKQPLYILETELNFELNNFIQKIKKILEPILIMIISLIILEVAFSFYNGIFSTINSLGL
jgi:type IV pilus assembly protein PilC